MSQTNHYPTSHRYLQQGRLLGGCTNSAIAAALVVSGDAAEKHIANIFAKLDLSPFAHDNRRVLAVLRYLTS